MKYAFGKSLRLLCSGEFKAVFDDAPFRASHQFFLLLARPNQLNHSRLGLVVAKKHLRFAVQRNLVKRITREVFRHQQEKLGGVDVILLTRKGIDTLDKAQFAAQCQQQMHRISKKALKHVSEQANECNPTAGT